MKNDFKAETPLVATPGLALKMADPESAPTGTASRLHAGDLCPQCKRELLDYDGLLNLSCPTCGIATGGCFT